MCQAMHARENRSTDRRLMLSQVSSGERTASQRASVSAYSSQIDQLWSHWAAQARKRSPETPEYPSPEWSTPGRLLPLPCTPQKGRHTQAAHDSDENVITVEIRGHEQAAIEAAQRISDLFLSSGPCRLRRTPDGNEVQVLVHADVTRGPGQGRYLDLTR